MTMIYDGQEWLGWRMQTSPNEMYLMQTVQTCRASGTAAVLGSFKLFFILARFI